MKRIWQAGIIASLLFALVLNFLTGTERLGLPAIKEVSDKYATLLTPATYAFSIWSLIYLLLIVFVIYQARDIVRPNDDNDLPQKAGLLFVISNICNGLWTYVFLKEWIGISVIVILVLTISLYTLLCQLRIALYDAPVKTIAFVWWPLMLYAGWVTAATVVNVASWLRSLGVVMPPAAAYVVLVSLGVAFIVLLLNRHVRELLVAGGWAIGAVGVNQLAAQGNAVVAATAFCVAGAVLGAVIVHGFFNRHSSPFKKYLR